MRSSVFSACVVLGLVVCAADAIAAEPDARVRPGAEFVIEFPELGPAEHGGVMRIGVYIPTTYSADKAFPLLAWFGGGEGTHSPHEAKRLAGSEKYVCVGISYRKSGSEGGGLWETPWSVYRVMLHSLEKAVPNIDTRRRAVSGFSSGGAAICHAIGEGPGGFQDYFHAFMPGGAGWPMGGLPSLRGRPMLIFMGDKDSRLSGYQTLDRMGKAAGIDMKFLVFEGFGHELPQQYVPQITAWLHEHVTYRGLTDTVNAMQRALRSRAWPQAFASAQEVLAVAEPSMDEYAAARDALEKLKATGEDEARTLLSGRPTVNAMKQFVRNWPGLECAKEVIERCDAEGAASLDRILAAGPVSALAVKKFIDDWEGFPVRKRALAAYDEIARAALQRIPTGGMANVRIRNLERFVEQWQVGSAVEEAKAQIRKEQEAVALKELAIIKKTLPIASRGTMLVRFINKYGQQECAAEARSLLEEAASDILERIKAIPNAASRNANLQTFVGIYADTAAGREAAGLIAGGGK